MSTIANLHTQVYRLQFLEVFSSFLIVYLAMVKLEFFYFLQFSELFSSKEAQALKSHLEFFALSEIAKTGKDLLESLFPFVCVMLSIILLHYHRKW